MKEETGEFPDSGTRDCNGWGIIVETNERINCKSLDGGTPNCARHEVEETVRTGSDQHQNGKAVAVLASQDFNERGAL